MKPLFQLLLAVAFSVQLQAQQMTITGTVTSASDGLPLPGVNVMVKGTSNGTTTDFDGNYKISASKGDALVFSYVGMLTKTITVASTSIINVALDEDSAELEEVVVMAYVSSVRRKKSVASVRVSSQSISKRPNHSTSHSLQGQVASVNITSSSGQLGANKNDVVIRGQTSLRASKEPLYVIDGVPLTQAFFRALNPNEIKSVSVLKDAQSTAIYGNRGANGVIVITTKSGHAIVPEKLYIVDGVPIPKQNNILLTTIAKADIDSKIEYNPAEAKRKFGKAAKHGCVVITTVQGNYRIQNDESYAAIHENDFEKTTLSPLSTFSIDVDKASYSNVRRMINNGETINPDAVKIEEMVNYFNYEYPQPQDEHPFSINTEVMQTPWHTDTQLVRIGLQGKTYETQDLPPSNLTFLIDVSGSMSSNNKLPLLKSAFKLLVNQLRK